jgi:diacylglycerol kinase family enzyme
LRSGGNCGILPAGLQLLPDASLDDGRLDVAFVDTRAGLIGWGALAARVALQGLGLRHLPRSGAGRLWHFQARRVRVMAETPHLCQVDGELVGEAQSVEAHVDAGALVVRVRG